MNAWETLCPGCFAEKGPVAVCPYCGYDESERRTPLLLPHRTVLNGQFIVGKVLDGDYEQSRLYAPEFGHMFREAKS